MSRMKIRSASIDADAPPPWRKVFRVSASSFSASGPTAYFAADDLPAAKAKLDEWYSNYPMVELCSTFVGEEWAQKWVDGLDVPGWPA